MDIFLIYRSIIVGIQLVSVFVNSNIFLPKTAFCLDKMNNDIQCFERQYMLKHVACKSSGI